MKGGFDEIFSDDVDTILQVSVIIKISRGYFRLRNITVFRLSVVYTSLENRQWNFVKLYFNNTELVTVR